MKKTIQSLLLSSVLIGALLTSCEGNAQSVDAAKQNVKESKEELKQAQLNAEYPAFKKDAEAKIAANDRHIADLRAKLGQPGKSTADDIRRQKIDDLQKKNADLRADLATYERDHSDWAMFKARFNHDADNLNQAFKDFGNDMKK